MEWSAVGERVREARLAAGLSQERLAQLVQLERTKIAKIESGDRHIDALELVRLSEALKVPMSHFLSARPQVVSRRAQIVEDTDSEAARESYRIEAALLAWLREVRQLENLGVFTAPAAMSYQDGAADAEAARKAALWLRDQLGLSNRPIETLMSVCEAAGQLLLVDNIPGDGASLIDGDTAVAIISGKADPGRRRATAAHELGHFILGDEYSSDLGVAVSRAEREGIVDAFASELLLPTQVISEKCRTNSRDDLVIMAARYRTSWSLAVRQAAHAGVIGDQHVHKWCAVAPTQAELKDAVGWAPQADLNSVRVPPKYAHAVINAWRAAYITADRAVELMHGQIRLSDLPTVAGKEPEP
ncbi:Transcriptional regulator [Alloactinosynnema sp. L-07]|uniref:helix-turn-helix domain-containing protein n=1 Tax=Alloactinosynnema sp. L-07 TaxID=1653480 RepID=UPI00065F01DC|nr:XRE family transcriptional regulator [Alloactinosynnema sp. L-07]CRK60596.1 Transcriptional regulator [Alloactinosynnema sp. L-07]